jgi:hypothetical protein
MLQHYVFIKYKAGTTRQHVDTFCERMLALRSSIDGVDQLEIGRDELHDARSWDLVLIMRLQSVGALRTYQQHPEHLSVMQFNDPEVAEIASVDFEKTLTI